MPRRLVLDWFATVRLVRQLASPFALTLKEIIMKSGAACLLALFLCACGSEAPPTADTGAPSADSTLDESAAQYRDEVRSKVSDSVANSLAREWNVSADKIRCLLGKVSVTRVESVLSDPEVMAAFEACDIDPMVVDR